MTLETFQGYNIYAKLILSLDHDILNSLIMTMISILLCFNQSVRIS